MKTDTDVSLLRIFSKDELLCFVRIKLFSQKMCWNNRECFSIQRNKIMRGSRGIYCMY